MILPDISTLRQNAATVNKVTVFELQNANNKWTHNSRAIETRTSEI